jgi:MscS family membrane protein
MDILEEEGVEFAFPTRTLIVEQDGKLSGNPKEFLESARS